MRPRPFVRRAGLAAAVAAIVATAAMPAAASTLRPATPVRPAVAAPCVPTTAACPFRIKFKPHAFTAQVHTWMSGPSAERWFVVHAKANQIMIVIIEGAGPTRGVVTDPQGHQNGQPGGRVFDEPLTLTGDYRIRVTEDTMAQAWTGRVDVVVVIY